jgi:NADH-quinone oxidoreductase subunit K
MDFLIWVNERSLPFSVINNINDMMAIRQTSMLYWEPIIWNTSASNLYIEYNILTLTNLICLGFLLFIIGLFGLLFNKGSLIFCLISIELIFVGLNFILIFIGNLINFLTCQIFVLILLTLAASETALGLCLIIMYHNLYTNTTLRLLKNFNI